MANKVGRGNRVLSVGKPREVFFVYFAFQSPLFRQLAVPLASNSGYSVRLLLARRLDLVSAGLGFLHDTLRLVPESLGHRLVTALHFFVADIDLGVSRLLLVFGGPRREVPFNCKSCDRRPYAPSGTLARHLRTRCHVLLKLTGVAGYLHIN